MMNAGDKSGGLTRGVLQFPDKGPLFETKTDGFCAKDDELCAKTDGFPTKADDFCSKDGGFVSNDDERFLNDGRTYAKIHYKAPMPGGSPQWGEHGMTHD